VLIGCIVLTARGSYKNIWKYTSYINIKNDIFDIALIYILSIIALFYIKVDPITPRTIHFLGFIFSLVLLYGVKLFIRYYTFDQLSLERSDHCISLIVGAGERGRRVSINLIKKDDQ
jgi:FlaA1/EpsC-like NDP-sugar epimerase